MKNLLTFLFLWLLGLAASAQQELRNTGRTTVTGVTIWEPTYGRKTVGGIIHHQTLIQIYTREDFDRNFFNAGQTFGSFNMPPVLILTAE